MAKCNISSFRYTDEVLQIIDNFEGNSRNDKFNNLLRFCYESVPARQLQLDQLESEIKAKREMLHNLSKEVRDIEQMLSALRNAKYYMSIVERATKQIAENYEGAGE